MHVLLCFDQSGLQVVHRASLLAAKLMANSFLNRPLDCQDFDTETKGTDYLFAEEDSRYVVIV